jgi:Fe-S cluster assembly protein SufD
VDAQPQLEILADDVQCSHGVAIGQLEEDAIFYLRSRGIGEKEAGRMLAQGFALEVIERAGVPYLKDELISLVDKKLSEQLGSGKG